ncbi:MAG: tripartite tricarboxylate transporter TctB family protein [Smithellaceae bacterium]
MDNRNLISSMVFLGLSVFVVVTSVGLGIGSLNNPQAGFMTFWISLLTIVFSLILLGQTFANRSAQVRRADIWSHVHWQKSVMAAAALSVYVLILPIIGYLAATSILMLALFKLSSMKILPTVFASLLAVIVSYGMFSFILKTPLPRGIWGF